MPPPPDRRDFFSWSANGLGATALLHLLQRDARAQQPHLPVRAKRAVQITLVGGLSHIDSFDYKPGLDRRHGQNLAMVEGSDTFNGLFGRLRKSDWAFRQRGQSGLWISELFPHIAKHADDLTLLRSMVADSANHTPALFVLNTGFQFNGFPGLGPWLSYGLGCETDDLPAYVVLPDDRGEANGGSSNWTSGFLPGQHQGVAFRADEQPVRDLFPARAVSAGEEAATRDFQALLNREHLERAGGEADLAARIRSYELAARMQQAIPRVARLQDEPSWIRSLYGMDRPATKDAGTRCLLARRLLERGVRFVQIYSGGPIAGKPRKSWDAHEDVVENHGIEAARIDQPVAALLSDLKQRGMLEDTLVLFTTEFGRTPFAQSAANTIGTGRDHNRYGFSCWLAGAGLKPGFSFGNTDEVGWKSVEDPITWNDFHATVLHLMGLDHERLTFYHNGIKRRLTNVHGEVVREILG